MGKPRTVPLVSGLIGGKTSSIYGQLEVYLLNHKEMKIIIRREPYVGRSDIEFSMSCNDFQDLLECLTEAHRKLDAYWLEREASISLAEKL